MIHWGAVAIIALTTCFVKVMITVLFIAYMYCEHHNVLRLTDNKLYLWKIKCVRQNRHHHGATCSKRNISFLFIRRIVSKRVRLFQYRLTRCRIFTSAYIGLLVILWCTDNLCHYSVNAIYDFNMHLELQILQAICNNQLHNTMNSKWNQQVGRIPRYYFYLRNLPIYKFY